MVKLHRALLRTTSNINHQSAACGSIHMTRKLFAEVIGGGILNVAFNSMFEVFKLRFARF